MSRRPIRALTALLAAAALTSAVSACGTSLQSQTYKNLGRTDGTRADVGGTNGVAVRNLHVEAPNTGSAFSQGEFAFATGALIDKSGQGDSLVGASSPVASSVLLLSQGTPVDAVTIPANGAAGNWSMQLTDLTQPLSVDDYIPVTLMFQHAGRITLSVPVWAGDNGLGQRTPEQNPRGG